MPLKEEAVASSAGSGAADLAWPSHISLFSDCLLLFSFYFSSLLLPPRVSEGIRFHFLDSSVGKFRTLDLSPQKGVFTNNG